MERVVDIEGVTAEWLTHVLGTEVASVDAEAIGTGQTAATYRLSIEGPDGSSTMIAKVASGADSARQMVSGGYRNEVGFYSEVLPTVRVRAPHCRYAEIAEDGLRFTLLLEDLTPRSPGVQVHGCPVERAEPTVRTLAGLHAPRWCDGSLFEPTPSGPAFFERPDPGGAELLSAATTSAAEQFTERYADRLDDRDAGILRDAADRIGEWFVARPEPFAVLHGDFRLDNLMFGDDHHDVVVVDWQTMTVGPPARDVAYFVGTSFDPDDRAAIEEGLVAAWCDELRADGVEGYEVATAFDDYRLGMLQCPLITMLGAIYSPSARSDAADEMFLAMARRSCAAMRHLDSLTLVPSASITPAPSPEAP